ncbi:MAG TPA: hypothetical protein VHL10_06675, partial [Nitrososphaera sp.]|nr:hypothetical protein [Nitrososphaera sp.]
MVEEDGKAVAEQQDEDRPVEEDIEALRNELQSVREELRKAKESSEGSLNKLKYLMADFDNYRKQMERQA